MGETKRSLPVYLRRLTQAVFLFLFLYLFLQTVYHPETGELGPITLFFDMDPLVMLTVWLGGHAVAAGLLLSLITLAVTFIFGRWFCGWVCPFGTVHNLFTAMRVSKRKEKLKTASYSVRQKAKYYLIVILLVCAFFGINLAGWLDPFSFFFRSMASAVFPAVNGGIQGLFDWLYNVNPLGIKTASEPVYRILRYYFLVLKQPHYFWGMMFGILFGIVIALNFFRARFWCRYICPLGGLLGIIGKNPVVGISVNADKCKDCLACILDCQGGAEPQSQESWKVSECLFCWNCHSICPTEAISFHFKEVGVKSLFKWVADFFRTSDKESMMDFGRRDLLAAGVVGIGAGLLANVHLLEGIWRYNPELIRPPGSVPEDEFLGKCIRCGECMKVCPTNVIKPAMLEAGLEGLWSPVVKTQRGYCEKDCNMCTQVCPTEAILPLSLEEKQQIKIGMAHIDKSRCLPHAYGRPCVACQEHCPVPGKAIQFEEKTILNWRGIEVNVKQPYVNPEICMGCGLCQNKCPVSDRAAIRVTSVGETRNTKNQFLTADPYRG